MKTKTKFIFGTVALILTAMLNFSPSNARNALGAYQDVKSFKDCWGSGNFNMTCSYDGATVVGCQPDPGSYCAGVRNKE
ncbi:hypothetical protein D9M68_581550 [compost metagenome]